MFMPQRLVFGSLAKKDTVQLVFVLELPFTHPCACQWPQSATLLTSVIVSVPGSVETKHESQTFLFFFF